MSVHLQLAGQSMDGKAAAQRMLLLLHPPLLLMLMVLLLLLLLLLLPGLESFLHLMLWSCGSDAVRYNITCATDSFQIQASS